MLGGNTIDEFLPMREHARRHLVEFVSQLHKRAGAGCRARAHRRLRSRIGRMAKGDGRIERLVANASDTQQTNDRAPTAALAL